MSNGSTTSTTASYYLKMQQEAEKRRREQEELERQQVRQIMERGVAPAGMEEKVVKEAMKSPGVEFSPGVLAQQSPKFAEIIKTMPEFQKKPVPLIEVQPTGSMEIVTPEDVAKFETDLSNAPLYLQQAYRKGGFDAYNTAVGEYNAFVKRWNESVEASKKKREREHREVFTELSPYLVFEGKVPEDWRNWQPQHDIAQFLRDNPDKEETLLQYGYSHDQISEAHDFNREYLGVGVTPYNDLIEQYFKDQGWKYTDNIETLKSSEIMEFFDHQGKARMELEKQGNVAPMAAATFVERYCADKGYKVNLELLPRWWAGLHGRISKEEAKLVEEAKQAYIEKYGHHMVSMSFIGEWGQLVFAPIRAVSPEVKFEDLTTNDWIIGATQLAIIASPFKIIPKVPTGVSSSTMLTGAGVASTYVTAKEWGNMTPGERVVAIFIDTLLLAPGIIRGSSYIKAKGDPLGKGAKDLINNSERTMAETIKRVKELYGDVAANWLEAVYGSQKRLVDALVKQQKKPSVKNNKIVNDAIQQVDRSVNKYTNSLEKNLKYDMPPKTYESLKNISKDIVDHTKNLVDDLIQPKARVKSLNKQLVKAEKALEQAKSRNPLKAHMWADELFRVIRLQNDIATITGYSGAKYTRIIGKLRREIESLKEELKKAKGDIYRSGIKDRLSRYEKNLAETIEKYKQYIKSLRLEYKKSAEVATGTGGGNKLLTKLDTKQSARLQQELRIKGMSDIKLKGGGAVRPIQKPMLPDAISPIRLDVPEKIIKEIQAPGELTEAQVANVIKHIYGEGVEQVIKPDIEPITEAFNKQLNEVQTEQITNVQVKNIVDTSIKEGSKAEVMPVPLIQPMPETRPRTKTDTETRTKLKEKQKKVTRIYFDDSGQDKKKRRAIRESLGAVTYRRGELGGKDLWYTYYVDKGGNINETRVLGPAPVGASVSTGRGSASATLKRIRGKRLPSFTITRDTGASDTIISSDGSKLTITFTGDIVSSNRGRISQGMPRISGGRGRITPKMPRLR